MERENPFKQIGQPKKEVPLELRQRVIKEVATAKLLMDMAALFTSNYKSALGSLFLTKMKTNKNK